MQEHPVEAAVAAVTSALSEAVDAPLWSLSDARCADFVSAGYQAMAQLHELVLRGVGEADRRGLGAAAGAVSTASWLAGSQQLRRETASAQVHLARALRDELTETASALAAGAVNVEQAQVIARAVEELPTEAGPEVRAEAEQRLLAEAGRHDARGLRILGRRVLEVVDPDAADLHEAKLLARQEAAALRRREHWFCEDLGSGTAHYGGRTDLATGRTFQALLESLSAPRVSDADGPDTRPYRKRLGDAMATFIEKASAHGDWPEHGGRRPTLLVTVDLDTLVDGLGAGTLDSGQPISPESVRRLACDAELIPAVLGGDGQVLDLGRAARLFSTAQRHALAVRDRGCAFPGCDRPPSWTETHHLQPWSAGGRTDIDHGVLLCAHHHRVIHDGHRQARPGPDGNPEFLPPAWIDPERTPMRNHLHHPRRRRTPAAQEADEAAKESQPAQLGEDRADLRVVRDELVAQRGQRGRDLAGLDGR